jgi:hypothetical protein
MITAIKVIERMFFYILIFTAVGQIPFKDKNIERHYHDFVNSSGFQEFFWTLASPVTWTVQKTASAVGIKLKDAAQKAKEESMAR